MSPVHIIIGLACIAFALMIHEFAHAWMSYQLGDPTAKYEGRLTLNPIVHFDPAGAICLVASYLVSGGALIMGWAKPVPIDPNNFKNRSLDTALVAAAGPFVNLFFAFLCSLLVLTGLVVNTPFHFLVRTLIVANVCFAVFNLIPWPPLDGWKITGSVLGESISSKMERWEDKLGIWSLLGLLIIVFVFGRYTLFPVIDFVLSIFLGAY